MMFWVLGWGSLTQAGVSQDANGWTVVTPSADTRVIYVSSSAGNDTHDGSNNTTAMVQTLHRGLELLRPGYPDHLLLKAGDSWTESGSIPVSGRSSSEPLLVSSYGTGPKPLIIATATSDHCFGGGGAASHIFVIGLDFYDPRKDPTSPVFVKANIPTLNEVSGFAWIDGPDDLLLEDCNFRFVANGIIIQYYNATYPHNVRLRRNVFTDCFGPSMPQAAFLYAIDTLLVEENIFDKNGWNAEAGIPANVFSHGTYIDQCTNVTVRGNLYLRMASLGAKFRSDTLNASTSTLVDNNFFFEGQVGIGVGHDEATHPNPLEPCFSGFTISNNVFLQLDRDSGFPIDSGTGLPTQDIGWGLDISDMSNAVVSGNIFTNFILSQGNCYGIKLEDNYNTGVTVANNVVYRLKTGGMIEPWVKPLWSGIVFQDNEVQDPDQGSSAINYTLDNPAAVAFSGNTYYTTAPGSQFAWIWDAGKLNVSGNWCTYANWVAQYEPAGSSFQKIAYPDPGRNLETYQESLPGSGSTTPTALADFIAAVRAQSKNHWYPQYSAAAVNDYIRVGFGKTPMAAITPVPYPTNTPTPTATVTPTATSQIPRVNEAAGTIVAYPNPAKGKVYFYLAGVLADKLTIRIYNLAGQIIAKVQTGSPTRTAAPLMWNAAGVAPGVYIYQVTLSQAGIETRQKPKKLALY